MIIYHLYHNQMKTMGENYLDSNQQLISSFHETMNVTKEMHKTFSDTVHKLVKRADTNNKNESLNLEQIAAEKFTHLKSQVTRYYDKANGAYKKCKRYTSWMTFGLAGGCVGKKVELPPEVKRFQLQTGNLKNSIKPLLQFIGDEKRKDEKDYIGTAKYVILKKNVLFYYPVQF